MFIWIFHAPNIQNEDANIASIEKTINAQLPDHLNDSDLFESVKTCQFHGLEFAGNAARVNVSFPVVDILLKRQVLQNHLILNLMIMKSKRF